MDYSHELFDSSHLKWLRIRSLKSLAAKANIRCLLDSPKWYHSHIEFLKGLLMTSQRRQRAWQSPLTYASSTTTRRNRRAHHLGRDSPL
eukprot:5743904-Amphidinium_carterae.1